MAAYRRSYSMLSRQPAWGLYDNDKLVATVRATHVYEARDIFRKHGLDGTRVKRITSNSKKC